MFSVRNRAKILNTRYRAQSVKIPKKKTFTEGDILNALRTTVGKPTLAIPWAEGVQHDHTLDFHRNDRGSDPKSEFLNKKELGVKAGEYVLRTLRTEFGWDASKGEWGAHDHVPNTSTPQLSKPEEAVELELSEFIRWANYRPAKPNVKQWIRKAIPTRKLSDIQFVLNHFIEEVKNGDKKLKQENMKKLYITLSLYIKQPEESIGNKLKKFKEWQDKFVGYQDEHRELVCDALDAIYFHRTFLNEAVVLNPDELALMVKNIKIPSTRFFNTYMRVAHNENDENSCESTLAIQREMRKYDLKPSPATFLAIYRGLDDNHKQIVLEDLQNNEILQLSDSGDFYDFHAFISLAERLKADSATDLSRKEKKSIFDENKVNPLLNRAKLYEKLIFQNPEFLPRDSFHEVFCILKQIQIRYATTGREAIDIFMEAPSQDFTLQTELFRWARENSDFNTAVELWQYMDASDSLRKNLDLIRGIVIFAFEIVDSLDIERQVQIQYIALTVIDMVSNRYDIWPASDMSRIVSVSKEITRMSIDILLKFNKHDPVSDFILVEALSDKAKEGGMVLDMKSITQAMQYAIDNNITALADICLVMEDRIAGVKLRQDQKDRYKDYLSSQKLRLLYR